MQGVVVTILLKVEKVRTGSLATVVMMQLPAEKVRTTSEADWEATTWKEMEETTRSAAIEILSLTCCCGAEINP